MDKTAEDLFHQLDALAAKNPDFEKKIKEMGLRPGHVLFGAGALVSLGLFICYGYVMLCAVLTNIYPMYMTVYAIKGKDDEKKTWLSYWCVFGLFQTVELFIGFILNFIPYYALIRLGFFLFLMMPQTHGAITIYEKFLSPFLK